MTEGDYDAVRRDIAGILSFPEYDDGSRGPLLVRLAWHASGTYDRHTDTGGSDGATMRFATEANDPANAGLKLARDWLEPIKARHPWITYADLWTLAGVVSIKEMGGPDVEWRPGRSDKAGDSFCPANGRLPDASKGGDHIFEVFDRMGFNDQETVALIGAHVLGRCHMNRSGYEGKWTHKPTQFSNSFFLQLTGQEWSGKVVASGNLQYKNKADNLMMLPADIALKEDPRYRPYVDLYKKDKQKFFQDFAAAFAKLLELGVKRS